jgi:hypothetical protein
MKSGPLARESSARSIAKRLVGIGWLARWDRVGCRIPDARCLMPDAGGRSRERQALYSERGGADWQSALRQAGRRRYGADGGGAIGGTRGRVCSRRWVVGGLPPACRQARRGRLGRPFQPSEKAAASCRTPNASARRERPVSREAYGVRRLAGAVGRRSADWQSAVPPTGNRRYGRLAAGVTGLTAGAPSVARVGDAFSRPEVRQTRPFPGTSVGRVRRRSDVSRAGAPTRPPAT